MMNFYPLFVPLAPLAAALLTALPKRYVGSKNYTAGWWIIFAGFLISLWVLWQAIQTPEPIRLTLFTLPWEVLPVIELSIDRLSAVMMMLISGFGTVLYRYSIRYLQQDAALGRYQTLLALKASSLLFMVASADLITIFICWQLSSWFLSLLAHNYAHTPTANSSFRTFIMLRFGALVFAGGIALAYHLYGTVQLAPLFEMAAANPVVLNVLGTGLEMTGATAIMLLIFVGAMSKSAQFPLHMWLPDSLYAPTPITALLHSGGINAGGFLLTRLAPLVVLSPTALHVILAIGFVTAILGTGMMLVQNDIKKALGYSTSGQMGYMIMECGLGAFSLSIFHLIAHGLFKADILLNCGKGIHDARQHPAQPASLSETSSFGFSGILTALILSLLVPLAIIVGVHYLLGIAFLKHQGLLILLLFSWVTASHAMLTLFKLNKSLLTKMGMLVAIGFIATAYFFAVEQFTHFLHPAPGVAEAYLQAAELPYPVFIAVAVLLITSIGAGWLFSVCSKQSGQNSWFERLQTQAYLFLINRLYLDGVAFRLFSTLKRIGQMIDRSPIVLIGLIILGISTALGNLATIAAIPFKTVALLFCSVILLPLFPFHGLYIAALTRAPKMLATVLCILLPTVGLATTTWVFPNLPTELLPIINILAIIGTVWGSIKALVQVRVERLLAYSGLTLYAIFWWHVAQAGAVTPNVVFFAWTVTLAWGGLFLAWDSIRARYGNLELSQIGGLFQPMPRLTICLGILIMAAVGLPPFGLFFGYLGLLLSPAVGISIGLFIIIATWFASCWYLFKLMQNLLFGPHRHNLRYDDLRPTEIVIFIVIIALLVIPTGIQQEWLTTTLAAVSWNAEAMTWIR